MVKGTQPISSSRTSVFSMDKKRLLLLDGDQGTVACRVHGQLTSGTLPRLSEAGTVEFATRSLLRMKNLSAVRGKESGARMVGPADYYGNLEKPHEKSYVLEINEGVPMFWSKPLSDQDQPFIPYREVPHKATTVVHANWTSGSNKEAISAKKAKYTREGNPAFGGSLFPNSGILEIHEGEEISLPSFDPRGVDLSSFKARLVPNDKPFQISSEPLQASDEYRAVSFLYDPSYAQKQVENGGGLFLETHDFAQTITPLDSSAKGFVNLAKWADKERTRLEIIAIQIPFGWTLIIDKGCIHGDATLEGMFMMCMTTNHTTMQTADSVFLKHPESGNNVMFKVNEPALTYTSAEIAPHPHVFYDQDDKHAVYRFLDETQEMNFIFNPFTSGFWKLAWATMERNLSVAGDFFAALWNQFIAFVDSVVNVLGLVEHNEQPALTSGLGFFGKAHEFERVEEDIVFDIDPILSK